MTSLTKGYMLILCAVFASLVNGSSESGKCSECIKPARAIELDIARCNQYKEYVKCIHKHEHDGTKDYHDKMKHDDRDESCSYSKFDFKEFEECDALINGIGVTEQPGSSQRPPDEKSCANIKKQMTSMQALCELEPVSEGNETHDAKRNCRYLYNHVKCVYNAVKKKCGKEEAKEFMSTYKNGTIRPPRQCACCRDALSYMESAGGHVYAKFNGSNETQACYLEGALDGCNNKEIDDWESDKCINCEAPRNHSNVPVNPGNNSEIPHPTTGAAVTAYTTHTLTIYTVLWFLYSFNF